MREPDLLLLDEPFGALDALTRIEMHRLVVELWRRHGWAVLLVTHDVEEALVLADRVLVIDGGLIAHEWRVDRPPRDRAPAHRGSRGNRAGVLDALGVETVATQPHPTTPQEHALQSQPDPHDTRRTTGARRPIAVALLSASPGSPPAAARTGNEDAVARRRRRSTSSKVTLNVGDQKGGAKALLRAAGELEEPALQDQVVTFTSGPPLLEALNAGAVDIGGVGNTPPVVRRGRQEQDQGRRAPRTGGQGRRDRRAEGLAAQERRRPQGQEGRGRPGQLGQLQAGRPAAEGRA